MNPRGHTQSETAAGVSLEGRESAIDLLRGLSVLAVLLYHYRPFDWPLFAYGLYGVTLFFVISGYCMSASLVASRTLGHFVAKRWARLLPALAVCGLLSTLVEHALPLVPDRMHGWGDWLATTLCVPILDFPCRLAGASYVHPDGAYWTLAVEFRFYFLIGVLFFVCGRRSFAIWFALTVAGSALAWAAPQYLGRFANFVPYLPFFLIGVAMYELRHSNVRVASICFACALFALAMMRYFAVAPHSMPVVSQSALVALAISVLLILVATDTGAWRAPARLRPLTDCLIFIGLISYPLYLLHQDIGLWLIALAAPIDGAILRGILVPGLVIGLAWLVHRFVEYRFRRALTLTIMSVFGARRPAGDQPATAALDAPSPRVAK